MRRCRACSSWRALWKSPRHSSAVPASVLVLASAFAHAQLTVEVSGAGSNRMPVAVAAFEGESALPRSEDWPAAAPGWGEWEIRELA